MSHHFPTASDYLCDYLILRPGGSQGKHMEGSSISKRSADRKLIAQVAHKLIAQVAHK